MQKSLNVNFCKDPAIVLLWGIVRKKTDASRHNHKSREARCQCGFFSFGSVFKCQNLECLEQGFG